MESKAEASESGQVQTVQSTSGDTFNSWQLHWVCAKTELSVIHSSYGPSLLVANWSHRKGSGVGCVKLIGDSELEEKGAEKSVSSVLRP